MFDKKHDSFFDKIGAKASFWFGLLSAIGIVAVIGFIILLSVYLSGGDISLDTDVNTNKNTDTNKVVNNQPTQPTADPTENLKPVSKDDWIRGDINAPVSIVEFSDIDCPFCQRFHGTMQDLLAKYEGEVNWVYRHFPLTSLHPNAVKKAEASECVGALGGNDVFWEFVDILFANSTAVSDLSSAAAQVGVDSDDFTECLNSGDYASDVTEDANQAVAAGGRGTPYSVVISGDQRVPISGAASLAQVEQILQSLEE